MGTLTPQGYVADKMTDIFDAFVVGLQGIYGDDILVSADDPDGQLAGILAQMRADVEGVILAIYQANDPDNATGAWLEQKVAYAGLTRREASYSYLRDVALVGSAGVTLKAGVLVKDSTGEQWLTETDVTFGSDGTAVNDFRSQDLGQYSVASGSELTIVTITNGWDSATAQNASELGYEEETDPQLLSRFYVSRSKPSVNAVDSTVGDLYALPDVKSVTPLENTGDEIDDNGTNPHTVRYIVDGGDNTEVAQAILDNWPGTGLQGSVTVTLNRKISGRPVDISFDRPTPVDMAAQITVGRRQNFTSVDTDAIAANIIALEFATGDDVYQDDLVDTVKQTAGVYVKSLVYGRKGDTLANVPFVSISAFEKARFLSGDVDVQVTDD
ncbi:baseplate J/gp47 family protein [Salmonella enterica subsp. enterica]|nr:baseplate J/gp47 family protein [Salmonella enterica subsp. enterica]EDR3673568.1 baseplate J/gp47 family protein [Salmonella enterica subsp. arizonae serovar 40:z4,z24:]